MPELKDDQGKRLKRHPVAVKRDCSLGLIAFDNLEWTNHNARIVDLSATGLGIESDRPLEPSIIWFKDCVYGQKCGVLVWCKQDGPGYRAGIQFVTLNQAEEEYVRKQVERSQPCRPLQDPERIVATLVDHLRKSREGIQ
jgi:PilZ domain